MATVVKCDFDFVVGQVIYTYIPQIHKLSEILVVNIFKELLLLIVVVVSSYE